MSCSLLDGHDLLAPLSFSLLKRAHYRGNAPLFGSCENFLHELLTSRLGKVHQLQLNFDIMVCSLLYISLFLYFL